jgi:aryl-alcohol dehydrogenase-like predicted oxidoreductase
VTTATTTATAGGTRAFRTAALKRGIAEEHFRELEGLSLSSIGLGTYLGDSDDETDELYRSAVVDAVALGVNVLDSAINYRCQRSERAIGHALEDVLSRGVSRDQVMVCTKGGYIPFDSDPPASPLEYLKARFFDSGICRPEDLVSGCHCLAPDFLEDQVRTSLRNLGLDAVDVYYLHNPETQLAAIDPDRFRHRLRAAFERLERLAGEGLLGFYGIATWNGYRCDPGARGALSLEDAVSVAREVAGDSHRFRFVQAPYNLAMTEIFTVQSQTIGDRSLSLLQAAEELGIHVVTSASIAQGRLTSGLPDWLGTLFRGLTTDAQRSLQFVRSTPGVRIGLVGMKTGEHVRENLTAARIAPAAMEDFLKLFEVQSDESSKK